VHEIAQARNGGRCRLECVQIDSAAVNANLSFHVVLQVLGHECSERRRLERAQPVEQVGPRDRPRRVVFSAHTPAERRRPEQRTPANRVRASQQTPPRRLVSQLRGDRLRLPGLVRLHLDKRVVAPPADRAE